MNVSYSCMNMPSIILPHNERLLRPRTIKYGCNCRMRENFLLQTQCLTVNLIYHCNVYNNTNKGTKIYSSLIETYFKDPFWNNKKDFNHEQYRKSTDSSKSMCSLKEEQIMPGIRWLIVENIKVISNKN